MKSIILFSVTALLYLISITAMKSLTKDRTSLPSETYGSLSTESSSYSSSYPSGNSTYISIDRSRDAWVCAIKYVEDNLKALSKAKFCKYTDTTVMRVGEDEYIIHGYVDTKNALRTTERETWTVSLFLTDQGFRDPYLEWG